MNKAAVARSVATALTQDTQALQQAQNGNTRPLEEAVRDAVGAVAVPDTWVYRLVVLFLGGIPLALVIAWAAGAGSGGLPEGLVALASAAVGALAGLLVPAPQQG